MNFADINGLNGNRQHPASRCEGKRLDDLQVLAENKANRLGTPIEGSPFPEGADDRGRSYQDYRWSQFKTFAPAEFAAADMDQLLGVVADVRRRADAA